MNRNQPIKTFTIAQLATIVREVDLMIEEWVVHFIKQIENDNHQNSNNNG
ncbi:MAG: hypothetical protein JJU37_11920 [Balneolaceae bacterium]|nr:hypothetical protein [Balneolaceae bacterium]